MRSALLAAAALALAVLGSAGARADTPVANPADDPWADLVFLPESGLSVLLERDPRGVLLDREGYLDLHRRARAARAPGLDPSVAERVLVARCEADGVVEEERVRWRVRMSIAVRGGGRETVALPAAGSVVAAFLDGAPAPLAASPDGKSLLLTIRGDGVHESLVEVLAPVRKRGGRSDVAFPLPAAAALRWSLEIPGAVTAETRLRASRVEKLEGPPRTRVVGYPDAKSPAAEAWWRAGDEGTDLPPLVGGSVRTLLEVGERAATALSIVRVEVARRPASR
ncbi:MAG TPA: hypothetical protein VFS92_09770, partial [Planctomycetota bacterium]|nr:hypothetical protein [Planctomycetota bacterium]